MENTGGATGTLKAKSAGTYDFGNPIEQVEAIDQAMRHYFGADRWVAVRNRLFPGLRAQG
jgi:hypothetical protein